MNIHVANSESEISACFPVFQELRPHLLSVDSFVAQVQRQIKNHGYVLVYLTVDEQIIAAAGYRVAEFLAWGRTFYVDDLITLSQARKQGCGGKLLDWLIDKARELSCDQLHLDSGVHRYDAHRLYMSRKMQVSSHHFSMKLKREGI